MHQTMWIQLYTGQTRSQIYGHVGNTSMHDTIRGLHLESSSDNQN